MGINERGDEKCQFNIQITGTRKQILSLFSSDELPKEIKQTLVCDEILKKNLDERVGMIRSYNRSDYEMNFWVNTYFNEELLVRQASKPVDNPSLI